MRCSSTKLVVLLSQCVPGALGLGAATKLCIRCCSAPADATSSSGRTSCFAILTRFTSATTSSSTTTASSTRRENRTPASASGAASSSAETRFCRARTAISSWARAPTSASTARFSRRAACAIGRNALIAAYCYLIGGDHDFSDASRPVLEQARKSAGITVGDGAWLGAGAKVLDGVEIGAQRRHRRRRRRARVGARARHRRRRARAGRRHAVSIRFGSCRSAITSAGKDRACTA